jgi:uncharacterized protein
MRQVGESLTGRIAIHELDPILSSEIKQEEIRSRHWLTGGYPDGGLLEEKNFPQKIFPQWQSDYLTLLSQKDLPIWGFPALAPTTIRLLRMIAHLQGEPWNASKIGSNLSLNFQTINSYVSFLESVFLLRKIEPYLPNLKKRIVKSPRVYIRDSGMLHSLLKISSQNELLSHPVVGKSWEGYVIEQILGTLQSFNIQTNSYFFRTGDNKELDLVLEVKGKLVALEIKLTSSPTREMVSKLSECGKLIKADINLLVCQQADTIKNKELVIGNLGEVLNFIIEEL